jgi:hypothetical protein
MKRLRRIEVEACRAQGTDRIRRRKDEAQVEDEEQVKDERQIEDKAQVEDEEQVEERMRSR